MRRRKARRRPRLRERYERRFFEILRELSLPLVILHFTLAAGTLGYMWLSGGDFVNSFYMTVITIGTIGFGEVVEGADTTAGRIFTTFLALGGIGVFTSTITVIARVLFKEELQNLWRRLSMMNAIEKLEGHYILAGFDEVTAELARLLERRGVPFVVLDDSQRGLARIAEQHVPYYLPEPPLEQETLQAAGIRRAAGMVVNLGDDARNISIIAVARLLRPGKEEFTIYSFASSPENAERLEELGANRAFYPGRMVAGRLAAYLFHPESDYLVALFDRLAFGEETDVDLMEVAVEEGSPWAGRAVAELRRELGANVVALRRPDGRLELDLTDEHRVKPGSRLLLFGRTSRLEKLRERLEAEHELS
ncbi:MAG TPA: potassium channel protein [Oceanithermus profundus]|uniref:Potassium channel protein n=1 Tax=Oceanithermus profundus TaxID=187137 RepID=A0A7C4VE07_9DEIN|nr:potassium channel protein [Oceanithermus profundus]